MLGTLIKDRYRIEKELGRGGFGAVYLARDTQLMDRAVVIKILLDQTAGDGWYKRKFEQEIEALSRIHHPGVVSVVDAGDLPEGLPYMVQEFVEGATLREAIRPGGMDLRRAAAILRKIGQALDAAHHKGVVHRDLKPDNIMLRAAPSGDEHVTLIDFGIASVNDAVAPEPEKTKVTGTFTYMAPEQFDGHPAPASDIYAMGVIAFEMLAGASPASGRPLFELMLMQKEGNWPKISELRPSVPLAAEEAITKALARAPESRYASATEFGETIAKILEDGTLELPRPATSKPSTKPQTGRRVMAWVLATLAAVGVFVAAVLLQPIVHPVRPSKPPVEVATPPPANRLFTYWITGQHFRGAKEDGPPFVLAKESVFRSGDKINIELEFAQDGHFYAVNQAPELRAGLPLYSSLFPSLYTKEQSSLVKKGQYLKLPENDRLLFAKKQGLEYIWFIFSPEPISALAGLPPGEVQDQAKSRKLLEFFESNKERIPVVETDQDARRTIVRSPAGISLLRIELSHK